MIDYPVLYLVAGAISAVIWTGVFVHRLLRQCVPNPRHIQWIVWSVAGFGLISGLLIGFAVAVIVAASAMHLRLGNWTNLISQLLFALTIGVSGALVAVGTSRLALHIARRI